MTIERVFPVPPSSALTYGSCSGIRINADTIYLGRASDPTDSGFSLTRLPPHIPHLDITCTFDLLTLNPRFL